MKTIGVVVKPNAPQGEAVLNKLIPWLSDQKKIVRVIHALTRIPRLDLIVVLGGDGTLLSVARQIYRRAIPILAVNMGNLGFLTDVTLDELYTGLTRVFENAYRIDSRMMLEGVVGRGRKQRRTSTVLNDVVISKGGSARGVSIEMRVNGIGVTAFRGDGLVIASATGSTAYTLSAGGPILHPSVEGIVITPIAPHLLTNRPIVVPASSKIEVIVKNQDASPTVAFDGQEILPLQANNPVYVRASTHRLNLVRSPNRNYYQVLQEKLKWGGKT